MSNHLPQGTTINGYRIERTLSEDGNFSVVYLAHDTDAERVERRRERIAGRLERWRTRYNAKAAATRIDHGPLVALKEYSPRAYSVRQGRHVVARPGNESEFLWGRERFVRESGFLSEHSHPNVAAVFDIFSGNGTEYYVMERLTGGTLGELIERGGPQNQAQVTGWLKPVLEGLASIERRDADHLDISPGNILFRVANGDPVLVDFGASRIAGSRPLTVTTRLVVNGCYSAPEKYEQTSSSLSARCDVYSLAALVNFAMSGKKPTEALERQSGLGTLDDASRARRSKQAGAAFLAVIDRAFALDPKTRFSDAREFSAALAAADSGRAPPRASDRSRRRSNQAARHKRLILLAVAAGLIVLIAAVALVL